VYYDFTTSVINLHVFKIYEVIQLYILNPINSSYLHIKYVTLYTLYGIFVGPRSPTNIATVLYSSFHISRDRPDDSW
jgi:hypothetical protein